METKSENIDLNGFLSDIRHQESETHDAMAGPYAQESMVLSNSPAKPDYGPVLQNSRNDNGILLEDTFKQGTPEKKLIDTANSLSFIGRFLFNRELNKLKRIEATKIAEKLYEYQFQACVQKLTLSLDLEKKRTFVAYMRVSTSLQRELFMLDAAARTTLSDMLFQIDTAIYASKQNNEKKIQALLANGALTNPEAREEREKNLSLTKRLLDDSLKTLENMWSNHAQLLEQTLTLFQQQLIVDGKL